jgi:hypothetical protein
MGLDLGGGPNNKKIKTSVEKFGNKRQTPIKFVGL